MSAARLAGLVVPVLFWAGGLARLPSALRSVDRRPLCVSLLAFAVALTANVPGVYGRLDRWLGVENIADLVEHVFGMIGVFALLVTLSRLAALPGAAPWRHWARVGVLVASVGASVGLFFAARLPIETTHFTATYGSRPVVEAYWAITLAYFGVALVELAHTVVTRSAQARRATLRVGLRMVGIGVIVGAVYSVLKIGELIQAGSGQTMLDRVDPVLLFTGAVLIGVGLLLPAADTARQVMSREVRGRIALLRLRPLWLDLTDAMPEVVLGERPSLWADLCGRGLSVRLHRREVEIRDVAWAARVGGPTPALAPERVETLRDGLAEHPGAGARLGSSDDELQPLLELAHRWGRHRSGSGVAA